MDTFPRADSSTDAHHLNIFLEYVPGGTVASLLNKYGPFEEALVQRWIKQTLTGLEYLHQRDIIHRDIKGANILVDNKGGIKIADFGISKKIENNLLSTRIKSTAGPGGRGGSRQSLQGSVFWMAPEVVKQTSYTKKADIWSVGCLVVEMLTGSRPWPDLTQMQALFRVSWVGESARRERGRADSGTSVVLSWGIYRSGRRRNQAYPETSLQTPSTFLQGHLRLITRSDRMRASCSCIRLSWTSERPSGQVI
jgi:serine/threonine protein kinase